jgi:hypothetical protein
MRWLLVIVMGALAVGCGRRFVLSPVGPARPALAVGCPVNIVRDGQPAYPHVDIAKARARCFVYEPQDRCLIKLLDAACVAGGDTVYSFAERAAGDFMTVEAMIAYRPGPPPAAPPPSPAPPMVGIAR